MMKCMPDSGLHNRALRTRPRPCNFCGVSSACQAVNRSKQAGVPESQRAPKCNDSMHCCSDYNMPCGLVGGPVSLKHCLLHTVAPEQTLAGKAYNGGEGIQPKHNCCAAQGPAVFVW